MGHKLQPNGLQRPYLYVIDIIRDCLINRAQDDF